MERYEMSVSELGSAAATPHLTIFEIFFLLDRATFTVSSNFEIFFKIIYIHTHICIYISFFPTVLDLTFFWHLASFVNPDMIIHTFD